MGLGFSLSGQLPGGMFQYQVVDSGHSQGQGLARRTTCLARDGPGPFPEEALSHLADPTKALAPCEWGQ